MARRELSVFTLWQRAGAYALTSLCAHVSGYFLHTDSRSWTDGWLLLALWATSLLFFLDYAISYHVEDPLGTEDEPAERWAKRTARKILPLGVPLLVAVFVLAYHASVGFWPHYSFWLTAALFGAMFLSYGWYTLKVVQGKTSTMRHRLVWPVSFAIAVPLYSGIIFSQRRDDPFIFLPLLCLIAFLVVTNNSSRKAFVWWGLAPLAVTLFFLGTIGYTPRVELFADLVFYLSIAAYLAVFEAWAITASLALQERTVVETPTGPAMRSRSSRYYLASLTAMCVAALSLPLLYIFSGYGRTFLYGISVHAAATFGVWYWAGGDVRRLQTNGWIVWKTIAGSLFLATLVVDGAFNAQPTRRIPRDLVDMTSFGIAVAIAIALITVHIWQSGSRSFADWWEKIRVDRTGVLLLTILVALAMGYGTLVVGLYQGQDDALLYKSDRAFMFYWVTIVLCSILLVSRERARPLRCLLGLLLSARLFTSSMIGLAVLLPAARSGVGLLTGILSSLPFFLGSAAGFLLNDFYDHERDAISKPFRPIPRGLLSPKAAWIGGWSLVGAALAAVVLSPTENLGRALQVTAVVGVVAYNLVVTRMAWLKSGFTALLCMLPPSFVIISYGYPGAYWWIVGAGYVFCIGRELLMDVLDLEGDKITGLRTIPTLVGAARSERAGLVFAALAVIGLLLFRRTTDLAWQQVSLDVALAGLAVLGALWLTTQAAHRKRYIVRLAWVPMLLSLAVFL